ncbi:MAG: hypothetical protein RLZZ200_892 [Pseudomonadota bacterium]|jgi:hypothetical protein
MNSSTSKSPLRFHVTGWMQAAALSILMGGVSSPILAQAAPPPGVDAARPPTERTLRPSGKSQNQERVTLSQDCRKLEADMREQYRIQSDSVRSQYASQIGKAPQAEHATLERERDARLRELHEQGDSAAKQFGDHCREGNKALLRAPTSPTEGR